MRPSYHIKKISLGIALAMLLSFPLTGDASLFSWSGNEAGMTNRFPIKNTGEQAGTWEADDMAIDYRYYTLNVIMRAFFPLSGGGVLQIVAGYRPQYRKPLTRQCRTMTGR